MPIDRVLTFTELGTSWKSTATIFEHVISQTINSFRGQSLREFFSLIQECRMLLRSSEDGISYRYREQSLPDLVSISLVGWECRCFPWLSADTLSLPEVFQTPRCLCEVRLSNLSQSGLSFLFRPPKACHMIWILALRARDDRSSPFGSRIEVPVGNLGRDRPQLCQDI